MNRATEVELMRLLHGELAPERAAELRDRIAKEPELAAAWSRMERTWDGLDLPPLAAVPPGFAQRTLARARRQGDALSWSSAPGWVRAAAAVALAAGVALGVGAGSWAGTHPGTGEETPSFNEVTADVSSPSLAETYWDCLEDLDLDSTAGPATDDGASL